MLIRRIFLIGLAAASLGLAACATGFTASEVIDPSHEVSSYQTFAWMSASPMIVGPTNRMPR